MGFGNPPALSSPLERHGDLAVTSRPSVADVTSKITCGATISGADLMSFRYMSLPYSHSPRDDMQGTCRSYPLDCNTESIMMDCFVNPSGLSNPQTNSNLINVRSNASKLPRVPEISHPEVSTRQSIDGNNTITADCFMNGVVFSTDYQQHPEVNMTFMPVLGGVAAGDAMTTQGGELKASSLSRSQISGTVPNLGSSTSMLQRDESFGQFGSPGKIDGSFLTLGTGANPETRVHRNFSTREIASKLDEVDSSKYNCHARQTTRNPLTRTEFAGRTVSFQTNAGGLPSSSCNLGGQISSCNDVGIDRGHDTRPKSIPFFTFQSLQADKHRNHSVNSNRDSDFQVDMAPSLMPFGSTSISHPECTRRSALASESAKPTMFPNQSTPHHQQNCYVESSMRVSSESFMNFHRLQSQGSSIRHAQLGNLVPLSKGHVVDSGPFPTSVQPVGRLITLSEGRASEVVNSSPTGVQHIGQLPSCRNVSSVLALGYGMIPERSGFQLSGRSTTQSAAGGPFPKRLGVQPYDLASEGDLHQTQNCHLAHYPQKPVGHPIATGPPQVSFPAQVNHCRLSVTAGQPHSPTQLSKEFPKADYTKGQVIPVAKVDFRSQASNVLCRPSLKRRANENSPAAPLVQRRKIVPQPVVLHSGSYQQKYIPPPVPAAPLHIKWQGLDGPTKPTGQKCLLCKRDLSFTPEGPIHQPAVSPAVAVLPCGHTFHDHCLQNITPEDQSKSPPCIPCAIGET
ncbi:Uncharacterized protein Adt_07326 [Abeliophyllum distichum]|uniref:RING-type domain-containing protein n=1 Tax=Abeliophyllum distichum TaxID=126358 RepID=A0ABD1VBR9_9LAMI